MQAQRIGFGWTRFKETEAVRVQEDSPKTLSPSAWDLLGPHSWGDGLRRLCLLQECAVRAQRGVHGEVLEVGKATRKGECGESLGDFRWGGGVLGVPGRFPGTSGKEEFLGTSVGRGETSGDQRVSLGVGRMN